MVKNQHTFAKRQREIEKRRKAEEKRAKRQRKRDGVTDDPDATDADGSQVEGTETNEPSDLNRGAAI